MVPSPAMPDAAADPTLARTGATGPPLHLEAVACPLCGGLEIDQLASMRDLALGIPGRFPLARCARCGLLHQNPRIRQDQIERAYPPDYPAHRRSPGLGRLWRKHGAAVRWRLIRRHGYRHLATGSGPGSGPLARAAAPLVAWWRRHEIDEAFPPWTGQGRLLDVGCASGVFLRQAAEAGWRVAGIEIDPEAATWARSVTPDIFVGDPTEAPFAPGSFDVVTSFHVVEHLMDPKGALRRMLGWLAPGGLLIVEVPNAGGMGSRVFGRYWSGLDFPRHLIHFTPATMTAMVERAGGRVQRALHLSKPLYIVRSVRHALADRRDLPSRAARALVSNGAGRRLLRRTCEALGPLGTATGRGEAVRYFIRPGVPRA